jgi:hypothetical protein
MPSDSVSRPGNFALFFFLVEGDMGLALLLDARDDGLEETSTTSCCLRFPANGVLERRLPLRLLSSSSLESNIDPAGALALRMFVMCLGSCCFFKVRVGVSVGGEEDGGGGGESALVLRFTTAGDGFLASKSSLSLLSAKRGRRTSSFCDTLFFFVFAGDFDSPPCISDILGSTAPEERVDSVILSS